MATLATLIPSTPGYIGTFDYFMTWAMIQLGNAPSPAAAAAFLVHTLLWLPPTIVGGAYLLSHPIRRITAATGTRPRSEPSATPEKSTKCRELSDERESTPAVDAVVVGGGFTGLAAAFEMAKAGLSVTILEAEADIGGLAAAFDVGGEKLDRFYHHWFTNDLAVMDLIRELGLTERVVVNPTNTGVYYAQQLLPALDALGSAQLHAARRRRPDQARPAGAARTAREGLDGTRGQERPRVAARARRRQRLPGGLGTAI